MVWTLQIAAEGLLQDLTHSVTPVATLGNGCTTSSSVLNVMALTQTLDVRISCEGILAVVSIRQGQILLWLSLKN
jgi:hypothetical protein